MSAWHLLTGEFPPRVGGVSDHSYRIAAGLAEAGDEVHVWCPSEPATGPLPRGVEVHRTAGRFGPRDLRRLSGALDALPAPRRLLVQWVPHAYGFRAMNLPFCFWVRGRARRGDRVEVIVHEPGMPSRRGAWRQNVVAAVHRRMARVLMRNAERVWVSAPEWESRWRQLPGSEKVTFSWLPLPTGIPVVGDGAAAEAVRARVAPRAGTLLGYFGLLQGGVAPLLARWLPPLLAADPGRAALLIGRDSQSFRDALAAAHPTLADRLLATGTLDATQVSHHLSACDLLLQPFPGGVNARRSSVVAALAHGVPVVTTDGSFTEPLWSEGAPVALVPEAEDEAVPAIARLLGDAAELRRLGAAGRALYDARFQLRHAIAGLRGEGVARQGEPRSGRPAPGSVF